MDWFFESHKRLKLNQDEIGNLNSRTIIKKLIKNLQKNKMPRLDCFKNSTHIYSRIYTNTYIPIPGVRRGKGKKIEVAIKG